MQKLLTILKKEKRDLWTLHGWSFEYFSENEMNRDSTLIKRINEIESQGVYCKCSECEIENETVDFTSESNDEMICEKCSDKTREYLRDEYALI